MRRVEMLVGGMRKSALPNDAARVGTADRREAKNRRGSFAVMTLGAALRYQVCAPKRSIAH